MLAATARRIFDQIHKHNLIYNQCWEDPRVDQEAAQIRPGDRIVMITSAGCNALDYLLHGPEHIDCVDMNPHQTALLELKLAAIGNLSHEQFFMMFGEGKLPGYREIYENRLRAALSGDSQRIWDRRIKYFDPAGPGLYLSGTAGTFARMIRSHLYRDERFLSDIRIFQNIEDLEFQAVFYRERIAQRLWTPAVRWMLDRSLVMCLLGVPVEQMELASESSRRTLGSFIEQRVDAVLSRIPIKQNYFWRAYMNGGYSRDCCPEYLRRDNFDILQRRIQNVRTHTDTLSDFLLSSHHQFSVFVLLDHMDWMKHNQAELREEWQQILRTARPGARIIFRSAALSSQHIPDFAVKSLRFSPVTAQLHLADRVGTYGSFHMATVAPA
jgi:S-adenosylmethionine-diacylglycerol 3-amino-3-carboxypropyl transferase